MLNLTRAEFENLTSELEKTGKLPADALNALEPYRVRRAIFIAAGIGERLMPITLNTPKPLVKVHGKRIIDGLIDACLGADIEEIYIVRGYLAEQFDLLIKKYPMIKFIENPLYEKANNISSALCAAHLMSNAYVLEADLLIYNPALIKKYQFASNFLGIKMEHSDDWCFDVKGGFIVNQKIGGDNCYQEVGISYWDAAAANRLQNDLQAAFDLPDGHEKYWDEVPLKIFRKNYRVEIRPCLASDIVEIDTFHELKTIDKAYDI